MRHYAIVNPISSTNLQKFLLREGLEWASGDRCVFNAHGKTLIWGNHYITYLLKSDEGYCIANNYEKVSLPPEFSDDDWEFGDEILYKGCPVKVKLT